jgi:hypothetical protein
MDIHTLYSQLNRRFRRHRAERFQQTFSITDQTTILDVGGTTGLWLIAPIAANITLLNIRPPEHRLEGFTYFTGDATKLPFADGSFDICFSNSVIEHVGTSSEQAAMAHEVRRVGRALWIQTPSRHFPIEPHYMAPVIHWLPRSIRVRLLRNFTLWGLITRPGPEKVKESVREIRLLDRGEMEVLFPDCEILEERFLGMTKSLIALRRQDAS